MKTVFTSREIAHVWANSLAPHGRSPGNLSFHGDAISSYSTTIGRRVTDRGRTAYILDRASFSNSTSKSQGHVWGALRDSAKVFHVECGCRGQSLEFTGRSLAQHYEDRAVALIAEMPSRYARIRVEQYKAISALYTSARDALEFFGYGTSRIDLILARRAAREPEAEATLKRQAEKMTAARLARERHELSQRTARNVAMAREYIAGQHRESVFDLEFRQPALALLPERLRAEFIAAVNLNNDRLAAEALAKTREAVDDWRAGKDVSLPQTLPTMLRVSGDELETSRGARVPLADAKRTFSFISACRAKGWHRNGTTHSIGGYQLEAVNELGIVAGCHRVTWKEIESFAAAVGWSEAAR